MISTPLGPPIPHKDVRAVKITYGEDDFCVHLEDGRIICTPLAWLRTLESANLDELKQGEIICGGTALAWENLDEHISIKGLLSHSPLYRRAERHPVVAQSLRIDK